MLTQKIFYPTVQSGPILQLQTQDSCVLLTTYLYVKYQSNLLVFYMCPSQKINQAWWPQYIYQNSKLLAFLMKWYIYFLPGLSGVENKCTPVQVALLKWPKNQFKSDQQVLWAYCTNIYTVSSDIYFNDDWRSNPLKKTIVGILGCVN